MLFASRIPSHTADCQTLPDDDVNFYVFLLAIFFLIALLF